MTDWHWETVTDDLLDELPPGALAAVHQVAEELTVRESMIFLDGQEFTGEPPGLRTVQRDPLMPAAQGLPMPASDSRRSRDKLTVDEICADLDISRRTFYEWRAKGTAATCIKLPNGELRVYRAVYQQWLKVREDAA